jgi:hypothetical protein
MLRISVRIATVAECSILIKGSPVIEPNLSLVTVPTLHPISLGVVAQTTSAAATTAVRANLHFLAV